MAESSDPKLPANLKMRPDDLRGAMPGTTTMPQPHGGSIGQAAHRPTERTRAYVRRNVFFMGQDACARKLGVSARTLRNHYRREIQESADEAMLQLGKTAMMRALNGDGPMLRFILACRGGPDWSPKYRHQHAGQVDVDVNLDLTPVLKDLSDDELPIARKILAQILAEGTPVESGNDNRSAETDRRGDRSAG